MSVLKDKFINMCWEYLITSPYYPLHACSRLYFPPHFWISHLTYPSYSVTDILTTETHRRLCFLSLKLGGGLWLQRSLHSWHTATLILGTHHHAVMKPKLHGEATCGYSDQQSQQALCQQVSKHQMPGMWMNELQMALVHSLWVLSTEAQIWWSRNESFPLVLPEFLTHRNHEMQYMIIVVLIWENLLFTNR